MYINTMMIPFIAFLFHVEGRDTFIFRVLFFLPAGFGDHWWRDTNLFLIIIILFFFKFIFITINIFLDLATAWCEDIILF